MAIFAHPDDETTIGPVLANYASISDVHLVVATDGRYGVTDHAGLPAGDSLVAMRKLETECACAALGINPPHFLEAKDGLGLNGHRNFYEEVVQLKERIVKKISELQPEVILTFGPDGDTGHPDHRMVGLLNTEILLRENLVDKIDLYHFAWTKEQTKKFPEEWGLGWSHPDVLHTKIEFSAEDEEKAFILPYSAIKPNFQRRKWPIGFRPKETIRRTCYTFENLRLIGRCETVFKPFLEYSFHFPTEGINA